MNQPKARIPDARKIPGWPRVPLNPCECGRSQRSPREQWSFTGRETHWGYTYLVWTRGDGKRWARVMH